MQQRSAEETERLEGLDGEAQYIQEPDQNDWEQ